MEYWRGVLFDAVIRFQKRELYGKILFLDVNDYEFAQVFGIFENCMMVASYFPETEEIKGMFIEELFSGEEDVGTYAFKIDDKIYYNFHYDFKVEGEKPKVINIMLKHWQTDYDVIQKFIRENYSFIKEDAT